MEGSERRLRTRLDADLSLRVTRRRLLMGAGATAVGAAVAKVGVASASSGAITSPSAAVPAPRGFSDARPTSLSRDGLDPVLGIARAAGASIIRFPLRWDIVATGDGRFDWIEYESLHRALLWYGLAGQPVILGCPAWLNADQLSGVSAAPYPTGDDALNALNQFACEALRHFNQYGPLVGGLEIWSRPNCDGPTFVPDAGAFRVMVDSVGLAVDDYNRNRSDQSAKIVISGGLSLRQGSRPWQCYIKALDGCFFRPTVGLQLDAPISADSAESAQREIRATLEDTAQEWNGPVSLLLGLPDDAAARPQVVGGAAAAAQADPRCVGVTISPLREGSSDAGFQPQSASALTDSQGQPSEALAYISDAWAGG